MIYTSSEIIAEIKSTLLNKFKVNSDEVINIITDFSAFSIPEKTNKILKIIDDDPDDNKFIVRFQEQVKRI